MGGSVSETAEGTMARSNKTKLNTARDDKVRAPVSRLPQVRKMNHLKDEVYRDMLLLEVNRPGAEMELALALLRAVVQSDSFSDHQDFGEWLKAVCTLGLQMIELSLGEGSKCDLERT
jgi:hypothetical protein